MKDKNIEIAIGALAGAVILVIATPFFPFDELAALAVAIIAGLFSLLK